MTTPESHLTTHELSTREEFDEATDLYRRVFGYQGEEFAINPLLMRGIVTNGGTAIGVRDEAGELVGFAYGFPGFRGGDVYQYSQAAVIAPTAQGKGIGRLLKNAQREVTLRNGMSHMHWAYDPFYARNGHFNLDVLDAVGRWFQSNFYGTPGSDRVIVDWALDAPATKKRVARENYPSPTPADWGSILTDSNGTWVPLPAAITVDVKKFTDEQQLVRAKFMESFAQVFAAGGVAVSCVRVTPETAVYLFDTERGEAS